MKYTYTEFLEKVIGCYADECGNRPCDRGAYCDRCMTAQALRDWESCSKENEKERG